MKTALCLLIIGTIVVTVPLAAQDRAMEGHWSCFTDPGQPTIYVTPIWDETAFMQEVQNGFAQLLWAKYKFKGRVSCSRANVAAGVAAKLQAEKERWYAQIRQAGQKVVDTGWKFVPATARLPHLCTGVATVRDAGKRTQYFYINKVINIPGSTQGKLSAAWSDHLNKLHAGYYFQGVGCTLLPGDSAAQQQQIDAHTDMYKASSPTIERLTWDYTPPSAAAVASDKQPAIYCEMLASGIKEWYVTDVQPVDPSWQWDDYTRAWRMYAKDTLKLDVRFVGACEPGTMKDRNIARATRKQQLIGVGGYKIHEIKWKYVP